MLVLPLKKVHCRVAMIVIVAQCTVIALTCILPNQRPVSVIMALNEFEFIYLPFLTMKKKELVQITVPAGHSIVFTHACLHSGGTNNTDQKNLGCLHTWWVIGHRFLITLSPNSSGSLITKNPEALIDFLNQVAGDEDEGNTDDESFGDDGGGKQLSK
jgi:hypothetical protein